MCFFFFFFSSRRRHTRWTGDWSSDVCSSDLDRDPAWRRLSAQLATQPPTQVCAAATVLIGVGHAVAEVLTYLDGGSPRTRGATLEIDGAGGDRRRSWTAHPRCDCRRGRRSGDHASQLI